MGFIDRDVIKYILQRDRFILTDYNLTSNKITYKVSRLSVPDSPIRSFENAFGTNDVVTMQIDIDDTQTVENVFIDGVENPYQTKSINGNSFLLTNVQLNTAGSNTVEIKYVSSTAIRLTVNGVTADDKVYDGTTAATIHANGATLVGVLNGDDVTLVTTGATGAFTNKNAGTAKTVTTRGFTLIGADVEKYVLLQPATTASISKATLTSSGITANNKVYDGNTTATLNTGSATLTGILPGDLVTLAPAFATCTFNNKTVGSGKTVTVTNLPLTGSDGGNYNLVLPPPLTANITRAILTVSGVLVNSKVYSGTTSATLNNVGAYLTGVFGSDNVNLISTGAVGTFADKNAGTSKTVAITGFAISGTDAGNYTLTQPSATGNITKAILTVSGVTANNKVYNATTGATLNTGSASLAGVLSGEIVTLVSTGATGAFVNKNVGTAKTVSTSGFTLDGTDAANYTVTQPVLNANITSIGLTLTGVIANNKVYNGTTRQL